MAEEESESFISKLGREKTLNLRVVGGRVFIESATPERHDCSAIELICRWSPAWAAMFDSSILIGDQKHKPFKRDEDGIDVPDEEADDVSGWSLIDCPIVLSIYQIDDGWLADNAARSDNDPIIGRFTYHAPTRTSDGFVNEKRPTVFAWLALGPKNFDVLREKLLASETTDFDLGLSVEFPKGSVESGWIGSKVRWNGEGSLPVTGGKVVWKRGAWDSDAPQERPEFRKAGPDTTLPSDEQVELLRSVRGLEAAIAKLSLPLWLACVAAVIAIVASR